MLVGVIRLKNYLFLVVQAEPFETFEDRPRRFFRRASEIGVFDPKQDFPAGFLSEEIIVKRGPGRTDVQVSGRARSKTDACRHKAQFSRITMESVESGESIETVAAGGALAGLWRRAGARR